MVFRTMVLDTIFEVDSYSKLHKITTPKTTRTDGWDCVFVFIMMVLDTIFEVDGFNF
jgi:hypothetical protein